MTASLPPVTIARRVLVGAHFAQRRDGRREQHDEGWTDAGDGRRQRTMTEAVLLDIDGTLVDSNDAHARACVEAFAEAGFAVPFAGFAR
jgi:hypothetical protein